MDHPELYTVREDARRAVLIARGAVRIMRGRDTAKVDKKLDDLAAEARRREARARQQ